MTIVRIEPLENDQHPIQSQSHRRTYWVEGYIEVPVHLETAAWVIYSWCDLQIEEGVPVGITPAEWPSEPELESEPSSVEEQVATLEEVLAQTGGTAIALFESRAEQESINAQQDDALLDIYKMLGS